MRGSLLWKPKKAPLSATPIGAAVRSPLKKTGWVGGGNKKPARFSADKQGGMLAEAPLKSRMKEI